MRITEQSSFDEAHMMEDLTLEEADQAGGGFAIATAVGVTTLVLGGSGGASGALGGVLAAGAIAGAIATLIKGCGRFRRRRGKC